ncbi:MAG: pyruvate kinase [Candidatus Omnitrophica bacterium]|nr:pyruvate kinase [Candidatus Omnitrophota bacterium]
MVKTKIICTIGPASGSYSVLRKMMLAGMDVVRLNFSHGTCARHAQVIRLIRALNKKYSRHLAILGDLEGYRIRIGKLEKEILLRKRQRIFLSNEASFGEENIIPFDYEGPLSDIKSGSCIYVDDGNIALTVKAGSRHRLHAEVVVPGVLKSYKGINIPGINLKFGGLTDKDKKDIDFSVKNKTDYIAQSFVRSKNDILALRDELKDRHTACKIIAKIENREGLSNIDQIMAVSDGIMVARGDMGVSMPIYEIAVIQKMIIKKCKRMKKIVITATQMLESMTENLRPTRAEVTDVANALLDGSDYLMLSAETAIGKHPVESVNMMNQIIKFTEAHAVDINVPPGNKILF